MKGILRLKFFSLELWHGNVIKSPINNYKLSFNQTFKQTKYPINNNQLRSAEKAALLNATIVRLKQNLNMIYNIVD